MKAEVSVGKFGNKTNFRKMDAQNNETISTTHGFDCPPRLASCKNMQCKGGLTTEVNPYYPNWYVKIKCCVCLLIIK